MTDDELLEKYKAVAEFIAQCFSDTVEVVLHDVRGDLEHSAVCIFNNHVSGREAGAPLTRLATSFLHEEKYRGRDSICNYEGVTINGVAVRASTFFIRNEQDEVIGFLCVNVDVSGYVQATKMLERLTSFGTGVRKKGRAGGKDGVVEVFPHDIRDMTGQVVSRYCLQSNKPNDSLVSGDKYEIISRLEKGGAFSIKGSIGEVAAILNVSEPTVYRYLKKIRKEN